MGLLDNLNFSQPFRISSLLPSEAQLQAFKDKSDAEALQQFSQDPNPIRRVPFNILTALGVNPTIAKAAPTTLDVAPVTGDISALADARTAFGQGDLATAGLLAAATILPGVPVGKVKGLLKKSDDTKPLLNVDDAPTEGIANVVPPTDNEPGIIAFHGSPYDFDQFKIDKINTGEGAQAFGYGLYFTDSEDIAKFYKNQIAFQKDLEGASLTYGKEPINLRDMQSLNVGVRKYMGKLGDELPLEYDLVKDPQNLKSKVKSDLIARYEKEISDLRSGEMGDFIGADGLSNNERQALDLERQLNEIKKVDLNQVGTIEPKTYKVALAPKPDELLDYDLPLGKQNKFIKERLSKVANEMTVDDAINLGFDPFDFGNNDKAAINAAKKEMLRDDQSVVAFLNNWAVFRGEQSAGEKLLNKHGIKGIKYKADQGVGARNVPETGKNNYVIFDENLINILAKYGIVGGVGITALQNSDI